MVERWYYPDLMIPYFDAQLMDNGGDHQGFPMTIEIVSLKEYFLAALSTTKGNTWDRVIARRIF
jgi:hypothetical protein